MTTQPLIANRKSKIALYWPLIKSTQTGLLLATGIAGYLSAGTPIGLLTLLGMSFSLFFAISRSTIMNMWYDRDYAEHLNLAGNADFGYPAERVRILEPGRSAWLKLDFSY